MDSLFPGLAVAGGARALALVHRGRLLLGRHPRLPVVRPETPNPPTRPPVALPASEAGWGHNWWQGVAGGFSASPFWRVGTLLCPTSSSQTHFRIVDSSQLNASRVYVLLRGRWLHWASPGGRSWSGAPAAVLTRAGSQRALGWHTAPTTTGAQLSHHKLMRGKWDLVLGPHRLALAGNAKIFSPI